MTPGRWREIDELFARVLEVPAAARAGWLAAHVADPSMRSEVESLLANVSENEGGVTGIQSAIAGTAAKAVRAEEAAVPGERIGPYRIVRLLGQGGMGAVYLAARDDAEFHKSVAIKVLRRGMDSQTAVERFRQERQILARLEHPNVARLLDGGATGDGLPYIVMEYVEGKPLLAWCEERAASLTERLRLFQEVCAAVQYAHQNLIVHRDLKSANILVTPAGSAKLLDFGIAKLLDDPLAADQTVTALRAFTPNYASPEQVLGQPVTTASDVYSLGVVLFELLTGRLPYTVDAATGTYGLEKAICEAEPPRPSSVVAGRAARQLRDDLDHIVLKALRKEPAARYASVEQLSGDVANYREGRPVMARRGTFAYRASRFVRRHRYVIAAGVLIAGSITGGVISTVHQKRRAELRFEQVRVLANKFLFDFDREIRQVPGTTKAREMLVATALQYLDSLAKDAGGNVGLASDVEQAYESIGDVQGMTGLPSLGRPADALASYRKAETVARQLLAADPHQINHVRRLARCLERLSFLQIAEGDIPGARRSLEEALRWMEDALRTRKPEPPDFRLMANGYVYLGSLEQHTGDARRSVAAARGGLEWMQRYVSEVHTLRARSDLARAYGTLGRQQLVRGELEEARRNLLAERSQREGIGRDAPADTENQRELLAVDHFLGNLHGEAVGPNLGEPAEAQRFYEESVAVAERLLSADPQNISGQQDAVGAYGKLADLLAESEPRRAAELYRKALAIADSLPSSSRNVARHLHSVWATQNSYLLARSGDHVGGRKYAEEGLAVALGSTSPTPGPEGSTYLSRSYRAAGAAAMAGGDPALAGERFARAVAVMERQQELARINLELAADLSFAWESLEDYDARTGRREEAALLRQKRLEFWQAWERDMPSVYTRRQAARAGK